MITHSILILKMFNSKRYLTFITTFLIKDNPALMSKNKAAKHAHSEGDPRRYH